MEPEGGGLFGLVKDKKKICNEEDGRREGGGAGGGLEQCVLIGSERILIDLEGSNCHILGINEQ